MELEVKSASNFLVHLIKAGRRDIRDGVLKRMRNELVIVLSMRYRDHWFRQNPFKGSGYRSIRINGKMDPVISQAGEIAGISEQVLLDIFPSEMTMWIDPYEVTYQIGESGSICLLYERASRAWKPGDVPPNLNRNVPRSIGEDEWKPHRSQLRCSRTTMDYQLDPRQSVSIEQLAAYVDER
jgi:protein Tob/BTG